MTTRPIYRDRAAVRVTRRGERLIGGFLMLAGLGMVVIWTSSLARGAFGGVPGLVVYQEGNYPILHLAAELLAAAAVLGAGVALWRGARVGRGLALLAAGMLMYAALNSSGWALHNDPALLAPLSIAFVGAAASMPYLLRPPGD